MNKLNSNLFTPSFYSDGNNVAATRVFAKDKKALTSVLTEVSLLSTLDNANIVKILGYVQTSSNVVPVIIMDYLEGSTLCGGWRLLLGSCPYV